VNNHILIQKGTIITHDKTIFNQDVLIENDKIILIKSNIEPPEGCVIIDATDQFVLPGLVDMHCEIKDPGYDYMEEFSTAGAAAIAGGYTTITCNPLTDPVIDNKAVVEYVNTKAKNECAVNVFPYGALTVRCEGMLLAELGEMQLAGIKAFSDGDCPIQSSSLMHNILEYSKMFDLPVIVHSEDLELSKNSGVSEGQISTLLGMIGAQYSAETSMIARNILLAEELNAKIHLAHISCKRSISLIRDAKKGNVKITVETSPQYFSLTDTAVDGFNAFAKLNPPLRKKADIESIKKAIADGTIDVICSDHKPNTIDSKTIEFELASFGMPGLETALSICYTELVATKIITMETLVQKMSYRPAQILSINKGKIAKDSDADIVVFNPNFEYKVNSKLFKTKAKYSPYDGKTLNGIVTHTIVGGKVYYPNDDIINPEIKDSTKSEPTEGKFNKSFHLNSL
jgi:dihydroorotase